MTITNTHPSEITIIPGCQNYCNLGRTEISKKRKNQTGFTILLSNTSTEEYIRTAFSELREEKVNTRISHPAKLLFL